MHLVLRHHLTYHIWHGNPVVCCGAGKGQFGDVLVATAYNIVADAAETLVMLKSLLSPEESTQSEFYRDLELFSRCHHDNVVKLLGISRESFPVFAIYEYTDLVSCSFITLLVLTLELLWFHLF